MGAKLEEEEEKEEASLEPRIEHAAFRRVQWVFKRQVRVSELSPDDGARLGAFCGRKRSSGAYFYSYFSCSNLVAARCATQQLGFKLSSVGLLRLSVWFARKNRI